MEEYSEAEEALEDNQTGQCGVNNGEPGPEDHYSNPPTVFSLLSVKSRSQFYSHLALDPTHPHNKALPPLC